MTSDALMPRLTSQGGSVTLSSGRRLGIKIDLLGDVEGLQDGGAVPVWLVPGSRMVGHGIPARNSGPQPEDVALPAVVVTFEPCEVDSASEQGELTDVLARLCDRLGREIVLLGQDETAEEALAQAAALGQAASCLVWSLPRRDAGDGAPLSPGNTSWGRRTVILQDAADPGIRTGLGPRMRALGYVHRGRGLHTTATGHCAIILRFGTDDHTPSPTLLRVALGSLLDPGRPARSVFEALQGAGFIDAASALALPRDLRREAWSLLADAALEAEPVASDRQSVRMSGVKTGVGGLTFEFSLTCDADDPTDAPLRVITASPSATLRTECPGTLKVAVVDGLGNRLQTLWSRWPIADSGAQRSLAPVVFVYGSCVTRDAFALSGAPPLADYIARSPLGSAFSPPPDAQDLIRLEDNPSAFQRRMVDVDLNKGLATLLESTRFDLLVLDFIDERLSMVRTGSGFVTYSPEAERCGLRPDTADLVSPGSAEHVAAFTSGLDALIAVVPSDRILVNKVYWATTTADGEPLAHADSIRQNNETLDALYTLSADRDLRFLHYPERVFVSDPAHKWGLSPFHYAGTLYDHTLRGIAGAFSDLSVHATASRR